VDRTPEGARLAEAHVVDEYDEYVGRTGAFIAKGGGGVTFRASSSVTVGASACWIGNTVRSSVASCAMTRDGTKNPADDTVRSNAKVSLHISISTRFFCGRVHPTIRPMSGVLSRGWSEERREHTMKQVTTIGR
jgi:hypothetical protein